MRILLVSNITPTVENFKAASALSYHLAAFRPKDIELIVLSYNLNGVPQEKIQEIEISLNCKIYVLAQPKWIEWVLKYHLLFIRLFLKFPILYYYNLTKEIITKINGFNPDGIWVNGEEMSRVVKQLNGYRIVHTLPDCESLYYKRMIQADFVISNRLMLLRQQLMYPKYRRMESRFDISPLVTCHLVGDADAQELRNVCPGIDARFIRHPHYEVRDVNREIRFGNPIRLLVAGQYNLYMKSTADEWFLQMSRTKDLIDSYIITFLGRGWDPTVQMLRNSGYNVNHITFAPDYIEEVCRHDIQLTPISIGTGTKGKVLDAIANGLLVIGTTYAMENIAVKNAESCIVVDDAQDMLNVLRDIPQRKYMYEQVAMAGRDAVLTEHGRKKVAEEFFSIFDMETECSSRTSFVEIKE